RVPMRGPEASTWLHYSTSGPMAARIGDVALALDVSVGPDPTDLNSLPMPRGESWAAAVAQPGLPKAVISSRNLGYGANDAEVEAVCRVAVEQIAAAGVEVIEADVFAADPIISWAAVAFIGLRRKLEALRDTPAWDTLTPGLRKVTELVADADMYAVYD